MRYFLLGLSAIGLAACMGQPPMDGAGEDPVDQISEPTDGAANETGTE